MAILKIGDKVKVIVFEDADKTGVIVGKGATITSGKVVPGKELEPDMEISWWKVKLDGTVEEKDFPDDILERIG